MLNPNNKEFNRENPKIAVNHDSQPTKPNLVVYMIYFIIVCFTMFSSVILSRHNMEDRLCEI